jgi:hypothetical protein
MGLVPPNVVPPRMTREQEDAYLASIFPYHYVSPVIPCEDKPVDQPLSGMMIEVEGYEVIVEETEIIVEETPQPPAPRVDKKLIF